MVYIILFCILAFFLGSISLAHASVFDGDMRLDYEATDQWNDIPFLADFGGYFSNIFFMPDVGGTEGAMSIFVLIAFSLKNFFIIVAVIFLIIGVLKLFFSEGSEEDVVKWRQSIIWTSIGIFVMQIAFSAWGTFMAIDTSGGGSGINAVLSWSFWNNILSPIVGILQLLASFAFIFIMIRAFYRMLFYSSGEEGRAEWIRTLIYAVIGFLLIKLPTTIVGLIYTNLPDCQDNSDFWSMSNPCNNTNSADLSGAIGLIGSIITWFNTFLTIICILLIIYTGILVLTSGGDEEKLSKAKRNVIYIMIGFVLLFASHAIFRFFILGN